MKILVLNYEYPPVGGGGGRLCQKLAEALVVCGHEVRVVTAGVGMLPRESESGGVRIFRPPTGRKREDTCSVPEMGFYILGAFGEAWRQAREWKPDVIHAHFVVPTGVLAAAVSRLTGIPYVVTAHLGDVPGGVPEQTSGLFRFVAPVARWVWRGAAARTAISRFVGELAGMGFGTPPDAVIPNGIPEIPPPATPRDPVPEILLVGRLSVQKNPLLAADALSRLPGHLAWKLTVIGKGPLEADFRDALGAAGLLGRVEFCGWLEEGEVRRRMERASILLMPSLHEGLPMAAVEALWHGLAIVGSRIGGMREVVEDGRNGALCPLDAGAFAAALRGLLEDPERIGSARTASLDLARSFDFAKSVDAYERVLSANATPGES